MNLSSIFEFLGGDVRAQAVALVDTTGTQISSLSGNPPANAALTSVAAAVTSAVLLAANPARRKFRIHNASGKVLYIAYGATASVTAFSVLIAANTDYESEISDYSGVISGIWSGTSGFARITEVTV